MMSRFAAVSTLLLSAGLGGTSRPAEAPSTWPSLPAETELRIDLAEDGNQPHLLRLALLVTPEMEPGTSAGSSAVVILEDSSATVDVGVTVASPSARVRVVPLGSGWVYREDGTMDGTIPVSGATSFRVTAFDTGRPGEPAAVMELETPTTHASIEAWVEPLLGEWHPAGNHGEDVDLDMVAVHAALVRDGSEAGVVFFSPPRRGEKGNYKRRKPYDTRAGGYIWKLASLNKVEIAYWDISSGEVEARDMRDPQNLFCAGHAHLPNGKLLVVGGHTRGKFFFVPIGHDADLIHVFDPQNDTDAWTRLDEKLPDTRWYPTVTALPDGRMLITSGRGAPLLGNWQDTVLGWYRSARRKYEIFDPATKKLVELEGEHLLVDKDEDLATYPSVFVLPGGERNPNGVVLAQERRYAWLYRYEGGDDVPLRRADTRYEMETKGWRSYPYYGSAAFLPFEADASEMRILMLGGQNEKNTNTKDYSPTQPPTATAEVFAFDNRKPLDAQTGWRRPTGTPRMAHARVLPTTSHLADGNVLVSGGAMQGWANCNSGDIFESELFDSESETFHRVAAAGIDRRYHSVTLLLPDATVLSAGSTGGYNMDNSCIDPRFHAERYYPSYLWRGPRPVITSLSPPDGRVPYRSTIDVRLETPESAFRLAIVRLGSTTHGNNMDQRYVWLDSQPVSAGHVRARAPEHGAVAPPGDYMLFVLNAHGVPSKARFIRLEASR